MKRTKNRIKNKIFKRVVLGQKLGIMQEFYARRAAHLISLMMDRKYETEFRPWWWEQDWNVYPLGIELPKFFRKANEEIELAIGIDCKLLNNYLKTLPSKPFRQREPKEPKEQPIRKLKNPQQFEIQCNFGDGPVKRNVVGEKVFSLQGYDFFIRHVENEGWVVSDVIVGRLISHSPRYKLAVKAAKERMEKNIEEYIQKLAEVNV